MATKTLKPFEKRKDFKDVKNLLKNRKINDFNEPLSIQKKEVK